MKHLDRIKHKSRSLLLLVALPLSFFILFSSGANALTNPQNGAVGLTGTIPSPPPSSGATIATPSNGQVFSSQPITVSGICPSGLLIKLFISNVFSGSAECVNGSYTITASLFNGTNDLVVVDYDALNQAGPSSSTTTVTYNNPQPTISQGITLTSNYAKLGADPGMNLSWPLNITGGTPPYAIDVSWGDNTPDSLLSQANSGGFSINHIYSVAGVYTILVKATDTSGNVVYLQLVGVGNGVTKQSTGGTTSATNSSTKSSGKLSRTAIVLGAAIIIIFPIATFWSGSHHKLHIIRQKLESGERPFK